MRATDQRPDTTPASTSSHRKIRPPILLIHGFRGAPVGLHAVADQLRAAGYDVHVPAIPPFGGAQLAPPYTAESYASYIAEYIKAHQLKRPVLAGHSMGSIVAAATAEYYPELISHQLILLSPISTRTPKPITFISPLSAFLPSRLVDRISTRFLFVGHDRELYHQALELTHECSACNHPTRRELIAATRFSTQNCIADFQLQQQILIIAGAHDHLIPARQTTLLAHQLGAELHLIPHAGHLHNYEASSATAQFMIDFLS